MPRAKLTRETKQRITAAKDVEINGAYHYHTPAARSEKDDPARAAYLDGLRDARAGKTVIVEQPTAPASLHELIAQETKRIKKNRQYHPAQEIYLTDVIDLLYYVWRRRNSEMHEVYRTRIKHIIDDLGDMAESEIVPA